MTIVVYLLIALGATLLGACTGGGGGILIKPILDLMGDYDAPTIGVLSAVTLLTMSAASGFSDAQSIIADIPTPITELTRK